MRGGQCKNNKQTHISKQLVISTTGNIRLGVLDEVDVGEHNSLVGWRYLNICNARPFFNAISTDASLESHIATYCPCVINNECL